MSNVDINELKRVLDGLEYCIKEDTPFADCPRCPYYTSEVFIRMRELRRDAYSVLLGIYRHEILEARLLTIDEVKNGVEVLNNYISTTEELEIQPTKSTQQIIDIADQLGLIAPEYWCGNCGYNLINHPKYCENCGKKVKWDD